MGQPEDKPGFIEDVLSHPQIEEPEPDLGDDADLEVLEDLEIEPSVVDTSEQLAPNPPTLPFAHWPVSDRALVDEALKKSGLVWLNTAAVPGGQGFWHVWLNDTIYLLTGGAEQPDGGVEAGEVVKVVVRSKETTARLVSFDAIASDLLASDDDWSEAAAALATARLNLHDTPGAPDRWARDRDQRLIRLTPSAPDGERPGSYESDSRRAAPRPTSATTAGPKPRVLHRRHGSGRPLS